jgi:PleD family two-component response regulator
MVKRILMVDDDDDDVMVLIQVLQSLDNSIEVKSTISGPSAIKLLMTESKPDLVFLDLVMPGMDGIECLTKLKSNRTTKRVPVILYTSSTNEVEKNLALKLGALDVLMKTSNMETLTQRLRDIVSLPALH